MSTKSESPIQSKKHAYLIMAHHRPDLLQALIDAIDDPRNDIFIHVDKKSTMNVAGIHSSYSDIVWVPRMNVNWGGYSQIECTLRMLYAAAGNGGYDYYHLMTGATYPLRSQDEIHAFFDNHSGMSAIAFDDIVYEERVRYYWMFNEIGKSINDHYRLYSMRRDFVDFQQSHGIDRFRRYGITCRKGLAYWSITHDVALYILGQRRLIRRIYKYSFLGDEQFVQTMVYNSPLRDKVITDSKGNLTSMRLTTWPIEDSSVVRDGHNFIMEDLPFILGSEALFALKFEGPGGMHLIDKIKKERNL